MQSFSVEVADEVGQRLTRLAAEHGLDLGETLRQAVEERVEELEDYYAVRERLGRPHRRVTDAEAWAGLEREG